MIAIHFGNFCFNIPSSEQSIIIVIAPKREYLSLDEFISKALKFLESDGEFFDNWTEMYKNRSYSPVTEEEMIWMKSRIEEMNKRIAILHQPIIKAVHIIPPEWNDITFGLETKTEYIFYLWGTSA